jgi:predicted ester cyclase
MSPNSFTSAEEIRRLITRVFEEVWNEGHVDVADEVFAERQVGYAGDGNDLTVASLKSTVLRQRAMSPDLHYVVNQFIVEGPWIATRWTGTGIGREDGTTVSRWGITLWRVTGHEIAEAWVLTSEAPPPEPGVDCGPDASAEGILVRG